jgi:hypothetical protein
MRLRKLFIAFIAVGIMIGGGLGLDIHDRNNGGYSDSSEGVIFV